MSLILPKGIVVNSPGLNLSIEKINQEPLELTDIAKFWKVYTTTQRRLLDPTAERLENYWWRIWGSRQRSLKGATVARLFAHISDGETFMPLRGPPNRDEGGSSLQSTFRHGPGSSSSTTLQLTSPTRRSTASSSIASKGPAPSPHPILKKSRGPSSSGPRPTARFISPHESQDEPEPSSSHSPSSHVVARPHSPQNVAHPERKRSSTKSNKKKGQVTVASTTASKKRPVIMRRQGSQNSHSSTDSSTRPSEAPHLDTDLSSAGRSPPNFAELSAATRRKPASSRVQDDVPSSSSRRSSGMGPSVGKRNPGIDAVTKRHPQTGRIQESQAIEEEEGWVEVSPHDQLVEDRSKRSQMESARNNNSSAVKSQLTAGLQSRGIVSEGAHGPDNTMQEGLERDTKPLPSTTHGLTVRHPHRQMSDGDRGIQNVAAGRPSIRATKSAVTLSPAPAESSGQSAQQATVGHTGRRTAEALNKGKERDLEQPRHAEMFSKRPVPPLADRTAPKPTFAGPLGKSKSQLTLLLEEDNAKSRKNGSSSGKDKR
ncbi:hypothetical protein B7463_g3920, partial [Scytalidium lignicola]